MTADQIRALRERLGETQPEFAERVGVSPPTLRSWEQGQRNPSSTAVKVLQLIADRAERAASRAAKARRR